MTKLDAAQYGDLLTVVETSAVIVTSATGDTRAGCLVTFNTPCSITPSAFAVGLSHRNHTYSVASRGRKLAVHLLDRSRLDLAELFGSVTGWTRDKFSACSWITGPGGVPLLAGTAWFCGTVKQRIPCGDHTLFVVTPDEAGGSAPLVTLTSRDVRHVVPGNSP